MRFKILILVPILINLSCEQRKNSKDESSTIPAFDTLRYGPYYETGFSDIVRFQLQKLDGQPLTSLINDSTHVVQIALGKLTNLKPKLVSRNRNVSIKEISLNQFELAVKKKIDGEDNYDAHLALLNTYDASGYILIRRDSASNELGYTEMQPFAELDTTVKFMLKIKPKSAPKISNVTCTYEANTKSLGIGAITLTSDSFNIYDDKNLNNMFWSDNVYNVGNNNQKCCAKFHKPDYGILNFVCLNQTKDYYEILVNDSIIKYMPNDSQTEFNTWEEYIRGAMGLRRSPFQVSIKPEENPFRNEPSEDAEEILKSDEVQSVCGLEVRGEWLKVQLDCRTFCVDEDTECETKTIAWIKWRKGEELLIDIALLS